MLPLWLAVVELLGVVVEPLCVVVLPLGLEAVEGCELDGVLLVAVPDCVFVSEDFGWVVVWPVVAAGLVSLAGVCALFFFASAGCCADLSSFFGVAAVAAGACVCDLVSPARLSSAWAGFWSCCAGCAAGV